MIADKAWDEDGQLLFNIFNIDGFLGDRMLVNWPTSRTSRCGRGAIASAS